MPTICYVFSAMIASPGDVPTHRAAVEEAIHEWNTINALATQSIYLPWRWETSAISEMGAHPQEILNRQGVDKSDVVVALFGSRLGSPTPTAVSGTVEEIERATAAGKRVHLYFSTQPLPANVDIDQLAALRDFKKEVQTRGLYLEYSEPAELHRKVLAALSADVRHFRLGALPVRPRVEAARFNVVTGWKPGMRPDEYVRLVNVGGYAAKNVTVTELSGQFAPVSDKGEVALGGEAFWFIQRAGDPRDTPHYHLEIRWFDEWTQSAMTQILDVAGASRPTPHPWPDYEQTEDDS